MIKRVLPCDEAKFLSAIPKSGVEAGKLRSLFLSYGAAYDFCKFYSADNALLGCLNNDFILYADKADIGELAEFFAFSGFSEIFCSKETGEKLSEIPGFSGHKIFLMKFSGESIESSVTENAPPLDEVYRILKTGFDIEFEPWYLDMSHRTRHGVTEFRRLDGSVLAVQYNLNGEALLSQIVSLPEQRGKHVTSRLILSVCRELVPSRVFVLCKKSLSGFYERLGFKITDEKYIIRSE